MKKKTQEKDAAEPMENVNFIQKPGKSSEKLTDKVDFLSQPYSRLVAGIILLITGILNLVFLGAGVGLANLAPSGTGSAFILGGFSWFYVTGLLPLVLGLSLCIYYIAGSWQGRIGRSDRLFVFHEKRPNFETITEVQRKEVVGMQYRNNKLGPKKIWILLLIPIGFNILQWILPLFNQPRAQTQTLPTVTFLTVVFQTVAMLILVLKPQRFFEAATDDKFYEFSFEPKAIGTDLDEVIPKIFDYSVPHKGKTLSVKSEDFKYVKRSGTFKIPVRFVLGIFLLTVSIISGFAEIAFGTYFVLIGAAYGVLLLVDAYMKDFTQSYEFIFDENNGDFCFYRKFREKFEKISIKNVKTVDNGYNFRRLDLFDIILALYLIAISYIQLHLGFLSILVPTVGVIADLVLFLILFVVLVALVSIFWIKPVESIKVSGKNINHQLEIPYSIGRSRLDDWRNAMRTVKKDREMKKTFIIRMSCIFALILTSMIVAFVIF